MYMGVKSYHELPRVNCYADAERALAVWNSKPRRGQRRDSVNFYERDRTIAFQLYDTEVVIWHPDNSVEIDNYGTLTTSGFANRFLPRPFHLRYPVSRRDGAAGGDTAILFMGPEGYSLCQGLLPRFREIEDGVWMPDADTVNSVEMPGAFDRKKMRELGARYNLGKFATWLSMAPNIMDDLEHMGWNLGECLRALECEDWRRAVRYMPVLAESAAFGHNQRAKPLNIETASGTYISTACVDKLKLALAADEGALAFDSRSVWPCKLYEQRQQRAKELGRLSNTAPSCGFS